MENYCSVTGELREWAKKLAHWWYDPVKDEYTYTTDTMSPSVDAIRLNSNILAIADRIDAALAERYVELPKDADGEYIHFGDVLDQFGTPMTVFAMSDPDPDQGDCMLELITDGISDSTWVRARKMRHHHSPTVEDVLREFAQRWDDPMHYAKGELVEQYAAKLRLAGDAE